MNSIKKCSISNNVDQNNNPTGGEVHGIGLDIFWQDGPLGRGEARLLPNGAFVETIISAVIQRIEFYQTANAGKFACRENALAITKLQEALFWLDYRTQKREERGVEGTHVA